MADSKIVISALLLSVNRKNCECCPVSLLIVICQVTIFVMNSDSQLLELSQMYLSLSLSFCLSGHGFLSL